MQSEVINSDTRLCSDIKMVQSKILAVCLMSLCDCVYEAVHLNLCLVIISRLPSVVVIPALTHDLCFH